MTIYYFPFTPNTQTASVRYRGLMVLNELKARYHCEYVVFFPGLHTALILLGLLLRLLLFNDSRNIYVFQKICKPGLYYRIIRFVLKRVKWSYYDMDDAVYLSENKAVVEFMVQHVHRVIVGAQHLKAWVEPHNEHVDLITTMLPIPEWIPPDRERPFTIGWIGKFHHHEDDLLEILFPALKQLSFSFRLSLIGIQEERDLQLIKDCFAWQDHVELDFVQIADWTDEDEINRQLRRFDVGTMPMVDSPFSAARSAFKLKQYSACGVPALVSPVGDTEIYLDEGVNGWLCRSEADWVDKFSIIHSWSDTRWKEVSVLSYQSAVSGLYGLRQNIGEYAKIFGGASKK